MSDSQPASSVPSNPPPSLVFIVDDEPMIGTIVELTLEMHGYQTKVFKDPATALEAFLSAEAKPDLLITDFNMPGMTGIELIRDCRAAHPQLKTILCSGTVDEAFLKSFVPQPDRFIAKPFFPQDLLTVVKALLAG